MFTFERSRNPATYPVGPALSMYDPIYLGVDEFGEPVYIRIIYRNILAGGEPGGGKSGLLNIITAHAALSANTRLVLFDGKQVELGMWDDIADEFVGPDLGHAITTMLRLQRVMDNRYTWLRAHRRRKVEPRDGIKVIVIVIDEIALYSATLGTEQEQKLFTALLRDLVARGRRRRHARHRRHPAAQRGHHPQEPARPVRLPRRLPLHQLRQLRHRPGRRLVRRPDSPPPTCPTPTRARRSSSPKAAPPGASKSPTCPTPTSSRWPTTRPGPAGPPALFPAPRRHTSPNPESGEHPMNTEAVAWLDARFDQIEENGFPESLEDWPGFSPVRSMFEFLPVIDDELDRDDGHRG